MHILSFHKFVYKAYILCVFLLFLDAMFPWYMWTNNLSVLTLLLVSIVSVLLYIVSPMKFLLTKKELSLILLIGIFLLWHFICFGGMAPFFIFIVWVILLLLKDDFKKEILQFITKWFAILLLVSLVFYIFFLLGFSIAPSYVEYQGRYQTWNYIFFTVPLNQGEFLRFKSIFMEPGHLTMGLVPLIMANRFNLRNKYVLMLFIAELFTFSLAGYITMFIGYLLFNMSLHRIKFLLLSIICFLVFLYVFDKIFSLEIFDKLIWQRLEYSGGDIAGNNRTDASFDFIYEDVMRTSDKWMGRNTIDFLTYGGNSGYKKYIVQYGLIGLFIAFMLYIYNYLVYKKYDIGVLTLILLLLLFQNAYPMWFCVFAMYILGTSNLKIKHYDA